MCLFLGSLPFVLFLLAITLITGGQALTLIHEGYVAVLYDLGITR